MEDKHQGESPILPKRSFISSDAKPVIKSSQSTEQPKHDYHKRSRDALAAARERFLQITNKRKVLLGKVTLQEINFSRVDETCNYVKVDCYKGIYKC
ncbi:hypothetical protein CMV_010499 [Castanea mollissima]|uniref:Uncharacterized protein n=1 Tax=Castanea mollissima TaxID=60419 RepID=A0A8J4RMU1_9ROSI|nr:hypothetical protein CMV_010499 [Castanea mollissima]